MTQNKGRRLWQPTWKQLLAVAVVLVICVAGYIAGGPESAGPGTWFQGTAMAPQPAARTVAPATPRPTSANATPAVPATERPASSLVQQRDWLGLARTFDGTAALAEVERLASPEFAGRQAGSPGGRAAAEHIAARFAELGLQPAAPGGGYLQEFTVPFAELSAVPTLTLTNGSGKTFQARFPQDLSPIINGAAGTSSGEGPLVWANHGAQQDLAGTAVTGAILICQLPLDVNAYRLAVEHRVAALLIVRDDPAAISMGRVTRETTVASQPIAAAYIGPDVTSFILADSGHTLSELSSRSGPVPLPGRARLAVATSQVEWAGAQNVLGALPGSDPDLSREVIILGAHYDHLGRLPDGTFFPGANDNASGVGALLEIARSWQAAGFVPKRTVLFAAWDGEEEGLLGSQRYVWEPSYPLADTVAMLQLDMIGASPYPVVLVDGSGLVGEQAMACAAELGIALQQATIGRSDHATFRDQQIPASMLISPSLDAPEYHHASDTPATISVDYYQQVGSLAELVITRLAVPEPKAGQAQPVPAAAGSGQ